MAELTVRKEKVSDREAVRVLNEAAFESPEEADLVEALHRSGAMALALVAELSGEVVGHITFSPVTVEGHPSLRLLGLGPMAVSPSHQRRGVGSALVRDGLRECAAMGAEAVVVLGHPSYYPRFGFSPAHRFGLTCEYDAPADAFMAIELTEGSLQGARGLVRYHEVFASM